MTDWIYDQVVLMVEYEELCTATYKIGLQETAIIFRDTRLFLCFL